MFGYTTKSPHSVLIKILLLSPAECLRIGVEFRKMDFTVSATQELKHPRLMSLPTVIVCVKLTCGSVCL